MFITKNIVSGAKSLTMIKSTVTVTSYVTVHVITSVITTVFEPVSNSSEFYKGVVTVVGLELILYLLFRKTKLPRHPSTKPHRQIEKYDSLHQE